jgi:hypothetical protein
MKRGRVAQSGLAGSLDSLVDIMTNSLGVLILAATLTVVGRSAIKMDLGTPIIRDARPGTTPVAFECRGNRIVPIDLAFLDEHKAPIRELSISSEERERRVRDFNARHVSNGFHMFEFRNARVSRDAMGQFVLMDTIIRPADRPSGDTVEDLKDAKCEFRRRLTKLDPGRNYIRFIARPDSFEILRAARQEAVDAGFDIGWDAFDAADPLVHGTGRGRGGQIDAFGGGR